MNYTLDIRHYTLDAFCIMCISFEIYRIWILHNTLGQCHWPSSPVPRGLPSSNLSGMLSCSPHMSKVHELQIRYINFLFCKSGSAPSPFSSFPFVTVFNFILLFQYHHYCRSRWLRGLVVIHPRPWLQAKAAINCLFIAITIHCDDDHHNHNHNHHPLWSWSS